MTIPNTSSLAGQSLLKSMSDTRNDAEQEMVNAGISSGMEDSLGVSDVIQTPLMMLIGSLRCQARSPHLA